MLLYLSFTNLAVTHHVNAPFLYISLEANFYYSLRFILIDSTLSRHRCI
jgi:hypothetical protein